MVHENKKKNDQNTGGSGKTSSALGQSQSIRLFFTLFASRLYSVILKNGF